MYYTQRSARNIVHIAKAYQAITTDKKESSESNVPCIQY